MANAFNVYTFFLLCCGVTVSSCLSLSSCSYYTDPGDHPSQNTPLQRSSPLIKGTQRVSSPLWTRIFSCHTDHYINLKDVAAPRLCTHKTTNTSGRIGQSLMATEMFAFL